MAKQGNRTAAPQDLLIVDGYNIVGVWMQNKYIKASSHDEARQIVIDMLADYQGYAGMQVLLVFDAHGVSGKVKRDRQNKLEIHYSAFEQTADQYIEILVGDAVAANRRVFVATADHLEQTIIFAKGAYRVTARELWQRLQAERSEGKNQFLHTHSIARRNTIDGRLSEDQKKMLNQWFREK